MRPDLFKEPDGRPGRTGRAAAFLQVAAVVSALTGLWGLEKSKPAHAQSRKWRPRTVSVTAHASSRKITRGDTITLTIRITIRSPIRGGRVGSAYDRYEHPHAPNFDIVGTSSSVSTQISFGGSRAERITTESITYRLRARKAGRLKIGPAKIRIRTTTYRSNAVYVRALPGVAPPPITPGQPPPGRRVGKGEVFIQVQADKKTCTVGEQVTVSWYLYHDEMSSLMGFKPVTQPSVDDFAVEDLYTIGRHTRSTRQVVNGRIFVVTPLYRKALFPKKAGRLKVGPLKANLTTSTSRLYGTGQLFRTSSPVYITAKEPPTAGRPAGFHLTNVGRFTVEAKADRDKVNAGEAVTLKVTVSGRGHPSLVDLSALTTLDGFKLRASKPEEKIRPGDTVSFDKTYEYVLIAIKGGRHTIPSFELDYFDLQSKAYRKARSSTLAVTVVGSLKPGASIPAVGFAGRVNILKKRIKPIHRRADLSDRPTLRFYSTLKFKMFALLPLLALLFVVAWEVLRPLLLRDTQARRWRRAKGLARRRFKLARRKMLEGDSVGFFAEVSRVLTELIGEKVSVRVQGQTSTELRELMLRCGFAGEDADSIIKELQTCDFARFAPAAASAEEMEETLTRARKLAGLMEKVRVQKPKERVSEGGAA